MKTFIVLALVAIAAQAAVVPSRSNQTDPGFHLSDGEVSVGDHLVLRTFVNRNAAEGVQQQDLTFHANTTITAFEAFEVGASQQASARVISGGVGHTEMTVRFESAENKGYVFQWLAWGL